MDIISRTEAKDCGLKQFFTGQPCKHGHVVERYVSDRSCVSCTLKRSRAIWAADSEGIKKKQRAVYAANPEFHCKRGREWRRINRKQVRAHDRSRYAADPAKRMANCKARYDRDPEKFNKAKRDSARKRYAVNPERHQEQSRKRYARNAEKRRAQAAIYRSLNRDRINADSRQRNAANREKVNAYAREQRKTPLGHLRYACVYGARALTMGRLSYSRLDLLDYDPDEFITHLESTVDIPNPNLRELKDAGYHVDHIIPISFISAALPNDKAGRILAFRVAMDLKNLRMIPGNENLQKNARLALDLEQVAIFDYLCEKYEVTREMVSQAIPY